MKTKAKFRMDTSAKFRIVYQSSPDTRIENKYFSFFVEEYKRTWWTLFLGKAWLPAVRLQVTDGGYVSNEFRSREDALEFIRRLISFRRKTGIYLTVTDEISDDGDILWSYLSTEERHAG